MAWQGMRSHFVLSLGKSTDASARSVQNDERLFPKTHLISSTEHLVILWLLLVAIDEFVL